MNPERLSFHPDPPVPNDAVSGDSYPMLRKTGRVFVVIVAVFTLAYYRLDVLPMAAHSLVPVFWLAVSGFVIGLIFRRTLFVPCFIAWWLVVLATVVRRSAMSSVPLVSQLFGGALLGYPDWAVRFAQALRLGIYFWALWVGAKLAHRLRRSRRAAGP